MQLKTNGLSIQLDDWIEVYFPFLPPPLDREFCISRVVRIYEESPQGLFGLQFEKPSVRLQTGVLREVERRHKSQVVRQKSILSNSDQRTDL